MNFSYTVENKKDATLKMTLHVDDDTTGHSSALYRQRNPEGAKATLDCSTCTRRHYVMKTGFSDLGFRLEIAKSSRLFIASEIVSIKGRRLFSFQNFS